MSSYKTRISEKIEKKKTLLEQYESARLNILAGGQSYTIKNGDDQRTLTLADLSVINSQITKLESEIDALEATLEGRSARAIIIGGSFR